MNNHLAPTYQVQFGGYWILWYSSSNNYSVVDNEFKMLLEAYLNATSVEAFSLELPEFDTVSDPRNISESLHVYLEQCNLQDSEKKDLNFEFENSKAKIKRFYSIRDQIIQINYDSELVEKTIHPSIAYLERSEIQPTNAIFDVYLDKEHLCLFKNNKLITAVPKRQYHLLQGKFIMNLLSLIHNKKESEWLGTFHGSTISNGNSSILLVGASGKGKSTLCALLSVHGFELVADDVSPMLSEDGNIYYNPSAISIKEGSFDILNPIIAQFDQLPETVFNKTKGKLKYLPCKQPSNISYPCKAIVMVNYEKSAETVLESITVKELLETLIPESWISHRPQHSKQFLDWLKSVYFYKLTYSETESVIDKMVSLFEESDRN
ncbi:hypothetical protein [Winogradskyella tangerina]|uniref:hypothetical protein n=1 Tax=Winogradskyella tangerina TaxID=2023240 RepID=UPI000DBE15EA|nr:hypothetical protein [Winogradskyella tangerina]